LGRHLKNGDEEYGSEEGKIGEILAVIPRVRDKE
jgi:hypothetical protein